jgi:hypothetical protein
MIGRGAVGLALAGLVLAGCAEKVSGHGESGGATTPVTPSGGSSTTPSSPGQTGETSPAPPSSTGNTSAPKAHLACPRVVDVTAHLAYDCVSAAMTPSISSVWPFNVQRPVDTHWTMDEGSGPVVGSRPAAAAENMVARMIGVSYGTPRPKTKTVQNVDVTVGSVRGHLIQTLITLDPGYVKAQHLRVKQERLWLVIVPVASGKLSGWYASIPDLAKGLWPLVPSLIKGLQIV